MRAAGLSRRAAEPTHVAAPLDPLMVPRPKHVSEVRSMGSMYKSTSADRLSLCPDPRASQPSRYAAVRDISRVVPTPKPSAPPHSGRIARGPVLLRIERFFRSQYVPAIEAKNRLGRRPSALSALSARLKAGQETSALPSCSRRSDHTCRRCSRDTLVACSSSSDSISIAREGRPSRASLNPSARALL